MKTPIVQTLKPGEIIPEAEPTAMHVRATGSVAAHTAGQFYFHRDTPGLRFAKAYGQSRPPASGPTPSRYKWSFRGVSFDFYRLCEILGITSHPQAHALKKVIRAGRSVKPLTQDIDEAIDSLRRWREMVAEDDAEKE